MLWGPTVGTDKMNVEVRRRSPEPGQSLPQDLVMIGIGTLTPPKTPTAMTVIRMMMTSAVQLH